MYRYWNIFRKYLGPSKMQVVLLAIMLFGGIGLQLTSPQIIRYFIDTLTTHGDSQLMVFAALTFLGLSVLTQMVSIATVYVGEDLGWTATNRLRGDLILHCLKLDMSFHTTHLPGEMIERIDGDVLSLANFFSRFVINVIGNLLLLLGVLITLAFVDIRFVAAVLAYLGVGMVVMLGLQQLGVPYWKASRQASAEVFGLLEEQLSGMEDIRSNNAQSYALGKLGKLNQVRIKADTRSAMANSSIFILWICIYVIGQLVAFWLSYSLFRAGSITIGQLYLVIYFTFFLFERFQALTAEIQNLQQATASFQRIESLLTLKSRVESPLSSIMSAPGALGVEFDKVTFGYTEQTLVLTDISFSLPPGKTLGLLGRTGSGKTTIARLLFRLYDPQSGNICLRTNVDIPDQPSLIGLRDMALDHLRQRIGMVTQNVEMFDASVRDNVTFFNPNISDKLIYEVLDELGLSEWITSLSQGLDTRLSAGNIQLSAGEAQLIAFARVFLTKPGLVILDEASSRLDPLTERRIEQAINRLLDKRTGIIVAHHLHTVERVDFIMIIEDGHILEFGERTVLTSDHASHFHRLLRTGIEEVLE
jgi:ATP-binding cassette, subfamily B, bacterial